MCGARVQSGPKRRNAHPVLICLSKPTIRTVANDNDCAPASLLNRIGTILEFMKLVLAPRLPPVP